MTASAEARPPRAERIAERRYARLSIAEARVAQIAPLVPTPPPPRPATVRRMARAGVPLGGPTPPQPVVVARPPRAIAQAPARPAVQPAAGGQPARQPVPPQPAVAAEGARALPAADAVAPATAEVAPDGTRSVLSAGGPAGEPASGPAAARSGPAVTQPPVELLPTPEAK